jgi:hypothetical protein
MEFQHQRGVTSPLLRRMANSWRINASGCFESAEVGQLNCRDSVTTICSPYAARSIASLAKCMRYGY